MSRLISIWIVSGVAFVSTSAWAAPMATVRPFDTAASATEIQYYPPCPPGYKVSSYGVCKLSHYLRRHPYQNQYNYYYQPSRRDYYDYERPRYYGPYYNNDNYDNYDNYDERDN